MSQLPKNIVVFIFAVLLLPTSSFAHNGLKHEMKAYQVGQTLGDGKNGRVWFQWKEAPRLNNQIAKVIVKARKQSGGNDTYINLRFEGEKTLDGGKKYHFTDNSRKFATWNLNRVRAKGRPLVLNAYNGQVFVETVTIEYEPAGSGNNTREEHSRRPGASRDGAAHRSRGRNYDRSYRNAPEHDRENGRRFERDRGHRARGYQDSEDQGNSEIRGCSQRYQLRAPDLEVTRVRSSGGLFKGKRRIDGIIKAACVEEAGYYEYGKLKQTFEFPLENRYRRREFSVQVRTGREGEIRIMTHDGEEESFSVEEILRRETRNGQGRNNGSILPF